VILKNPYNVLTMAKEAHSDFVKKGSSFCEMKFIRLTDTNTLIGKPVFSNI
jgi:hypothetical protein